MEHMELTEVSVSAPKTLFLLISMLALFVSRGLARVWFDFLQSNRLFYFQIDSVCFKVFKTRANPSQPARQLASQAASQPAS